LIKGGSVTELPQPLDAAAIQAPGALDVVARLQLDYQQATDLLRGLTDIRFKLLALVPTLSGAAVALMRQGSSAAELVALGLLGFSATVGVLLYELRNSQLYDYAHLRATRLEAALGSVSLGGDATHGLFSDEPKRELRLLGLATVDRDSGLALVYSAAIAGWSYLIVWGALHAAHVHAARPVGLAIGALIGVALLFELSRIHRRPGER
jgi:hypothetical protein